MPDIGSATKPIAFGDLNRFWIRQVANSFTVFLCQHTRFFHRVLLKRKRPYPAPNLLFV